MKIRSIGILSILILLSTGVWAEEERTLSQVLDQASKQNLSLIAARRELKIHQAEVVQAGAAMNPEFEGEIGEIPFGGGGGDTTSELGVSQTFQLGGKRRLRRQSAQAEQNAALAEYALKENQVFQQVKESYWTLSLAKERVNFSRQNLKFQQRFLARVQDRFQSSQAKLADVARAKLEVSRVSNEFLTAQKDFHSARAELNRLMGEKIYAPFPGPVHLGEKIEDFQDDALLKIALEKRPEIKILDSLEQGAKSEGLLAQRLLWTPDLTAGWFSQRGEREDGQKSWGGRLGISLPLWYQYTGERQAASALQISLAAQKEALIQTITLEIYQSLLELDLSKEQINLWKQAVDQATEAARLAEQAYMEGTADLLVFVQTRRDLVDSTLDYLNALRDYQVHLAALETAVGEKLNAR